MELPSLLSMTLVNKAVQGLGAETDLLLFLFPAK